MPGATKAVAQLARLSRQGLHSAESAYHDGVLCGVVAPEQDQREACLAGFREDRFNVLVATDVGSQCLLCAITGPAQCGPGGLP